MITKTTIAATTATLATAVDADRRSMRQTATHYILPLDKELASLLERCAAADESGVTRSAGLFDAHPASSGAG